MMSGIDVIKKTTARVSTDKMSIVLQTPMSSYATETKNAFNLYLLDNDGSNDALEYILDFHPKVIARKHSVAKLRKRDCDNTDIVLMQRIPLPYPCKHTFSTEDDDPIFFGSKYIEYEDGSTWLHLDLLADTKDAYTATRTTPDFVRAGNGFEFDQMPEKQQRDDTSMGNSSMGQSRMDTSATSDTDQESKKWNSPVSAMMSTLSPMDRKSPASASLRSGNKCVPVHGNSTPSPQYYNRPLHHIVTTTKPPRLIDNLRSTFISAAMQPVTRLLKVSIPNHVDNSYDGVATNTRSVKSAKRKSKTQD